MYSLNQRVPAAVQCYESASGLEIIKKLQFGAARRLFMPR
jgi:hypothetical protein